MCVVSGCLFVMSAVLSTNASPSLSVCFPVGLVIWNATYVSTTDHKIVSSTAVHIAGAAQLPCPTPRMRRSSLDRYYFC